MKNFCNCAAVAAAAPVNGSRFPVLRKIAPALFGALLCLLQAAQAQQVITVGTPSGTASTNSLFSTSTTTNKYSKTVVIYSAADIVAAGGAAGNITALRFDKQGTGEYTFGDATLNIYYKQVPASQTAHSGTLTWTGEVTGATQVYATTTQSFPVGPGFVSFQLNSPIPWNGTSNLVILLEWFRPSTPTADIRWSYQNMGIDVNATRVGSSAAATDQLLLNDKRPVMQLVFGTAAANDLGTTAISGPASGCNLNTAVPVSLIIRNYGSAPQTGFNVGYRIGLSPAVVENVGAAAVPAGGTYTYTFAATANLSSTGTYPIRAFTSLPADANHSNDTTALTVVLSQQPQLALSATPAGSGTQLNATVSGSTGPFTYAWTPATGLSATTIANPVANPPAYPFTYHLTITDIQTGCTDTASITATLTGMNAAATSELQVQPNPFCDQLRIKLPSTAAGQLTLQLTDALGRACVQQVVRGHGAGNDILLALPVTLPAGIYLLHVTGPDGRLVRKLLKE